MVGGGAGAKGSKSGPGFGGVGLDGAGVVGTSGLVVSSGSSGGSKGLISGLVIGLVGTGVGSGAGGSGTGGAKGSGFRGGGLGGVAGPSGISVEEPFSESGFSGIWVAVGIFGFWTGGCSGDGLASMVSPVSKFCFGAPSSKRISEVFFPASSHSEHMPCSRSSFQL